MDEFVWATLAAIYFLVATGVVLAFWYLFGGRGQSDYTTAPGVLFVERLSKAGTIVVVVGILVFAAGLVVAFTGYFLDQPLMTRVGAVGIVLGIPIVRIAEHWNVGKF